MHGGSQVQQRSSYPDRRRHHRSLYFARDVDCTLGSLVPPQSPDSERQTVPFPLPSGHDSKWRIDEIMPSLPPLLPRSQLETDRNSQMIAHAVVPRSDPEYDRRFRAALKPNSPELSESRNRQSRFRACFATPRLCAPTAEAP